MDHGSEPPAGPPASEPLTDVGVRTTDVGEPSTDIAEVTESTGDANVDAAIAGLGRLPGLPLDNHVAVFEDTHTRLGQVLSELDAEPADGQQAGRADG